MPSFNTIPTGKRERLWPFLGLSALLHGLIVVLSPAQITFPAAPPLQLALAQVASGMPAAPERATELPPDSPPEPAPAAPRPKPVPPSASANPPEAEPEISHSDTGSALASQADTPASRKSDNDASDDAAVLTRVRTQLTRNFDYPFLARREGWQGEVLLGFSITPEGRIEQVRVVRSSGHRLLDEAARASLARVGNLPDYVAPPHSRARRLQIPIIYRLAEG